MLRVYPLTDNSVPAHYARAYAYHRESQLDRARAETDALLMVDANDPYFLELKGQILFEEGRPAEAVAAHHRLDVLRVVADDDPVGLLAHRARRLAATGEDRLLRLVADLLEDALVYLSIMIQCARDTTAQACERADEQFKSLLMASQHSLELSNALIESVLDGMEAKAVSN